MSALTKDLAWNLHKLFMETSNGNICQQSSVINKTSKRKQTDKKSNKLKTWLVIRTPGLVCKTLDAVVVVDVVVVEAVVRCQLKFVAGNKIIDLLARLSQILAAISASTPKQASKMRHMQIFLQIKAARKN